MGNDSSLSICNLGFIPLSLSGGTSLSCQALHVPMLAKCLLSVDQVTRDHNCYFICTTPGYFIKDM